MNSILKLDDDKKNVLAWSSGNHAQAIASACYLTNKNATIVMPEDSPNAKLNGTKSWGANIVTFDRYSESREEIGTNLAKEINAEIIPPFDHPDVINGQGTVGYEIIKDCKKNEFRCIFMDQPSAYNKKITEKLNYGQSITDACMGWDDTEKTLRSLAGSVRTVLNQR